MNPGEKKDRSALLLCNAVLVPMDGDGQDGDFLGAVGQAALRIRQGRIVAMGELQPETGEDYFDCGGLWVLPGFVQGHVHYCQTLFRGLADDLALLPWLRRHIWPLEAAHDRASTRISARLAVAELLLGGTTTAQVMESVRHAEESFAVAEESGMTTILGNCLMDVDMDVDVGDEAMPMAMPMAMPTAMPTGWISQNPGEAMALCEELHSEFHGRQGRLHYAISPRFLLSCSEDLLRQATAFAREKDLRVHSHACEHPDEIEAVRQSLGLDYISALHDLGLLSKSCSLAHLVHVSAGERALLQQTDTAVLHCPTANLKLGSGIAPVAEYDSLGLRIALGADGVACNNRLSLLRELHLAALLQCHVAGPGAFPAQRALHAATLGGARALGLEAELGSLSLGKRADLLLLDLSTFPLVPGGDIASRIVYAAETVQVRHVLVGGEWKVKDGRLLDLDVEGLSRDAQAALGSLLQRAGFAR